MSLSSSECFSDLLCTEDAGIVADGFPEDIEESIAGLVEEEGEYVPGIDYLESFKSQSLDASARQESIAWILKVHAFYNFQPLTAYLSVNYLDRFLSSRRLPQANGWALQLLSVACLSLAAKMEEPLVPSLLDFQVEGAKFIFESRTIRRMELLVLSTLDWRLRSITPFDFIDFFANKVDSTGTFIGFMISRATQLILIILRDFNFTNYWPSSVAAAAILCAANEIPNLSRVNPGSAVSWCDGLSKERIVSCHKLMQEVVVCNRKRPRVLPQLRVTARTGVGSSDSSSSSSFSSPFNKKRKSNILSWVVDEKDKQEEIKLGKKERN